jgi:hypothetical protein
MSLSDIPNPTPVIIPASEERVFDKQFCQRVEITAFPAATNKPWTTSFVGYAYDGSNITGAPFRIELRDLKALALMDAEIGQAMAAVLSVVGKYLVKGRIKGVNVVTVDNIEDVLE